MSNVESYLNTLREQGGERQRVTRQMQVLVASVMDRIARDAEEGATVKVLGTNKVLTVRKIESPLSTWRTVTLSHEDGKMGFWDNSKYEVLSAKHAPWQVFFFDNDMDLKCRNAGRAEWLAVANSLPAIAAAFAADTVKVKEAILSAIRELRTWAEGQ